MPQQNEGNQNNHDSNSTPDNASNSGSKRHRTFYGRIIKFSFCLWGLNFLNSSVPIVKIFMAGLQRPTYIPSNVEKTIINSTVVLPTYKIGKHEHEINGQGSMVVIAASSDKNSDGTRTYYALASHHQAKNLSKDFYKEYLNVQVVRERVGGKKSDLAVVRFNSIEKYVPIPMSPPNTKDSSIIFAGGFPNKSFHYDTKANSHVKCGLVSFIPPVHKNVAISQGTYTGCISVGTTILFSDLLLPVDLFNARRNSFRNPNDLFSNTAAAPGFSGGPVVFLDPKTGKTAVIAINSSILTVTLPFGGEQEILASIALTNSIIREANDSINWDAKDQKISVIFPKGNTSEYQGHLKPFPKSSAPYTHLTP